MATGKPAQVTVRYDDVALMTEYAKFSLDETVQRAVQRLNEALADAKFPKGTIIDTEA